jgi:hypothetical protein
MKSKWIEYNGQKIFYQDFSNHFYNEKAITEELKEVEKIVLSQPHHSLLILSNFSNTEISSSLMPILNKSAEASKAHIRKTAVLGVTGVKRALAEMLARITGHSLSYFTTETEAKEWLIKE